MKIFFKIIKTLFYIMLVSFVSYKGYLAYEKKYSLTELINSFLKFNIYKSDGVSVSIENVLIAMTIGIICFKIRDWMLSKIKGSQYLEKFGANKDLAFSVLSHSSSLFILLIALFFSNIPLTILTLFGGVLAIGLGFGTQAIFNNFISGLILNAEQPIKVGDFIDFDGYSGSVSEIGNRSTKIKTKNNSYLIIPNSELLSKKITNYSIKNDYIRDSFSLFIKFDSDPEKCISRIINILGEENSIFNKKCFISGFAEGCIVYNISYEYDIKKDSKDTIQGKIRLKLYNEFKQDLCYRETLS